MSTSALASAGNVPPEVAIPILKAALKQVRLALVDAEHALVCARNDLEKDVADWPDMCYVQGRIAKVVADAHMAYAHVMALRYLTVNLMGVDKAALVFPCNLDNPSAGFLAAKGGA